MNLCSKYVHGFRGKFQTLTKMNNDDLAPFFEKLFEHTPTDPASQRMVALQEREAFGHRSKGVGKQLMQWAQDFA